MPTKSELQPTLKLKVIDLVREAGIDVSKWAKFKGGKARAAANPKHCYQYAFIEPKKVVVLNWWFKEIKPQGRDIIIRFNLHDHSGPRGRRFQAGIGAAIRDGLPIRIIILDGKMKPKGSVVSKRQLDTAIWHVTKHNQETGLCIITRGAEVDNALNDLPDAPLGNKNPDRASKIVAVIKRIASIRNNAIQRANGKCEYCNEQSFEMENGSFYLEAHHIIALCNEGEDTVDNVIALCPQHHRQAHYGKNAASLENEFILILKKLNKN